MILRLTLFYFYIILYFFYNYFLYIIIVFIPAKVQVEPTEAHEFKSLPPLYEQQIELGEAKHESSRTSTSTAVMVG